MLERVVRVPVRKRASSSYVVHRYNIGVIAMLCYIYLLFLLIYDSYISSSHISAGVHDSFTDPVVLAASTFRVP